MGDRSSRHAVPLDMRLLRRRVLGD